MANVLFDGLASVGAPDFRIMYARAVEDSADGMVLVSFSEADELEPGFESDDENALIVEAFDDDEMMAEGADVTDPDEADEEEDPLMDEFDAEDPVSDGQ